MKLLHKLINDNQTNRERAPKFPVTGSESLAAINDTANRKISLATVKKNWK